MSDVSVERKSKLKTVSPPAHADVAPAMQAAIGTPWGSVSLQEIDQKHTLGLCISRDGASANVVAIIPEGSKRTALSLWSLAVALAIRKSIPWWRRAIHRVKRFFVPRAKALPLVVPPAKT